MTHLLLGMPGGTEMLWVLVVVLVLFGGRKLPELARAMGTSITQFKRGLKDDEDPPGIGEKEEKGSKEGGDEG